MNKFNRGKVVMISVLLLHLLSTFSLSHALLAHVSPLLLMTLRMLFGGALILGSFVISKKCFKIEKNHLIDFAQVIVFALLVPYYLRYWALSAASTATTWYFSGLFITYIFSTIFKNEQFSLFKSSIIGISYCGLYAVLGFPTVGFGWSEMAMIASVISFTYGWIVIRRLIVEYAYDPLLVNGFTMWVAGTVAGSLCLISESFTIHGNTWHCALLLAIVILVSNVMVHTRYMALLKEYSLIFIQLCGFIIPCWQLLWTRAATFTQFAGIGAIALSIILYYFAEQAQLFLREVSTSLRYFMSRSGASDS